MTSNRHQSIFLQLATLLALTPQVALGDVSVSGRVEQNISAESRSVGSERALKLGVIGLTALNIDEINSALSGMGNNAVREPIGSIDINYGYVGRYHERKIYSDTLIADLVLPIGNKFGLTTKGYRYQVDVQSKTYDVINTNLFWKNPKEGSYSIGLSRTEDASFSGSERHVDLELGYSIRDPDRGFLMASFGKVIAGRYPSISASCNVLSLDTNAKGYSKSFSAGAYLGSFEIHAAGRWEKRGPAGCSEYVDISDHRSITAKHLWEKATLSLSRNLSNTSTYSNFSVVQGIYYPADNLLLSIRHQQQTNQGRGWGYEDMTTYNAQFQPNNDQFKINLEWKEYENGSDLYGIKLTTNLGRKRSLKAADRDRDPF